MVGCGSSSSSTDNTDTGTSLGSIAIAIAASDDFAIPAVSGDATGTGSIILNRDTGALSGSITASDLAGSITAGHIHSGLAGTSGGIIVTLEVDTADANKMNIPSGTVLSADQMTDLLAANYYFNIHTSAVGSGEIRAQITPADYQVIRSSLEGKNTVPSAVTSSNNGISYVTINTSSRLLRGNVNNTGLDDATALHIHSGFAGNNGGIVAG